MIFLIEYNQKEGKIVSLREYEKSRQREAEHVRIEREVELNRQGVDHEVVLLEADSEAALRRTHRRYFESLQDLKSGIGQTA